jgi:hypothetical protein
MYNLKYGRVCRHMVKNVEYVPDRSMCVDILSKF